MSDIVAKEQKTARMVLELALRSITFLAHKGLPLRGHSHRDLSVMATFAGAHIFTTRCSPQVAAQKGELDVRYSAK